MTSTFEAMLARIDRTSPSLAEVMPALVRLFQMHDAHIDRLDDHRARLHMRIDFLEDRMTDMEARVPGPINNTTPAALTRDIEELARRVDILTERLVAVEHSSNRIDQEADKPHTLINDTEKELKESIAASDRARVRGDDAMHDLVTRTANSL